MNYLRGLCFFSTNVFDKIMLLCYAKNKFWTISRFVHIGVMLIVSVSFQFYQNSGGTHGVLTDEEGINNYIELSSISKEDSLSFSGGLLHYIICITYREYDELMLIYNFLNPNIDALL